MRTTFGVFDLITRGGSWTAAVAGLSCACATLGQPCTPAPQIRVADLTSTPSQSGLQQYSRFAVRDGIAYFPAFTPGSGWSIFQSDGSAAGTQRYSAFGMGSSSLSIPVYATSTDIYYVISAQVWHASPTANTLLSSAYCRPPGNNYDTFVTLNDRLIYTSCSGVFAARPNGSSGITHELIAPAPTQGGLPSTVSNAVTLNGRVFFAVSAQSSPLFSTLYSTDGSAAGTEAIITINGTSFTERFEQLTVFNNRVFMSGWSAATGRELWSTDGTPGGTAVFADITPGSGSSWPQLLGAAGNRLYVWVYADALGQQPLLSTDGTPGPAPMSVVAPVLADPVSSESPRRVIDLNGKALFLGQVSLNDTTGREPWITDGTAAGTRRLADINPGGGGLNTIAVGLSAVRVGNRAVFLANPGALYTDVELWSTDGTPAGTQRLLTAAELGGPSFPSSSWYLVSDGTLAHFPRATTSEGTEPWVTDGTPAGTRLLKDINPALGSSSTPGAPVRLNNSTLLFSAGSGAAGIELIATDGSEPGTRLVADIAGGSIGSTPLGVTALSSSALLITNSTSITPGRSAFMWDGASSAVLLAPPPALTTGTPIGTLPTPAGTYVLQFIGLTLVSPDASTFAVQTGAPGNVAVASQFTVTPIAPLAPLGSSVLFAGIATIAAPATSGNEPCIADGPAGSARLLRDVNPGGGSSNPQGFTPLNNGILFFAIAPGTGSEPWFTDGTTDGTVPLGDLYPGSTNSWPSSDDSQGVPNTPPAVFNGRAFFPVNVPPPAGSQRATRIAVSDGTPAGTQVLDLGVLPRASNIAASSDGVFFVGADPATPQNFGVYVTDGSLAGTRRVADAANFRWFALADDRLYFCANIPGGTSPGLYLINAGATAATFLPWPQTFANPFEMRPIGAIRGNFLYTGRTSSGPTRVALSGGSSAAVCFADSSPTSVFAPSSPASAPVYAALTPSRLVLFATDPLLGNEPRSLNFCSADFNNSGGSPTVQDVFDFLNSFFAVDPAADINNSGGVPTVQDVFEFIAMWFAGCE